VLTRLAAHLLLLAATAAAPDTVELPPSSVVGDRLTGFVLPVEPAEGDIQLAALRARSWSVEDTRCLLLERDAKVHIGQYDLRGDAAVVWLNRIPSPDGLINQIAVYFEQADQPASYAGLGVRGRQLLVTGSARGKIELEVALLQPGPPPKSRLVREGQRRLGEYLSTLLVAPLPPLATYPQFAAVPPPAPPVPEPGGLVMLPAPEPEAPAAPVVPQPTEPPLFEPEGMVWFSVGHVHVDTGEQEDVITAWDPVVVQYVSDQGEEEWSQLTLSAQRAVVFTDPGPTEALLAGGMSVKSIRGIYLEGNVVVTANEGDYTVRAPQVYYDFRTNRAIMTEAILRTYDRKNRIPVHARAEEMRQIAANQWTAQRAKVSTSEFFTPHFALGARRVTVTERPGAPGPEGDPGASTIHVESQDNTLEMSGVPFLYWPRLSGNARDMPLRNVSVGARESEGIGIRTAWNLFSLLGREAPSGVDSEIKVDYFTERGPGGGLLFTYDRAAILGGIDLYYLHDRGTDRTSSGLDVVPSTENRGVALWEHDQELGGGWTVQGQASYISDPTFITTWRDWDFYNRREYETTGYLRNINQNTGLDLLTKYNLNSYISNSYLLASRAYQVRKLPEFSYRRYGDSLLGDSFTYSGETRASYLQFSLETSTPAELGVPAAAFGIPSNTPVDDALRAAGYRENWIGRFDTRHELAMPLKFGAVNMVPFVVGRITAYSDNFEPFNGTTDQTRYFGAAGLRVQTQIQRVDNSVENRLLDLHRIRHIIEPRLVAWWGATNIDDGQLPVYDQSVESIGGGGAVELGVRNVWQTQRGGPGRWHSSDVLTVDASVELNTADAVVESPNPRFFAYRPEYSQFGDHVYGSLMWLLSDQLSVAAQATYDLENNVLSRGSVGTELRHSPSLTTYVEYRVIDADSTELLELGIKYLLTTKYTLDFRPQWDFDENQFRSIVFIVTRRFPDFELNVEVGRDYIQDETFIAASLGLVQF
jgi:hypothetical protein